MLFKIGLYLNEKKTETIHYNQEDTTPIVSKNGVNYQVVLEEFGNSIMHRHVDHLWERSIGHVFDTEEENLSILPNERNPALAVEPGTIESDSENIESSVGVTSEQDVTIVNPDVEGHDQHVDVFKRRQSKRVIRRPKWMSDDFVTS